MQPSIPNIIEELEYPKYCASLAITSFYKDGGQFDANAVLKLVPTRFDEEGKVVKREDFAKSILLGSLQDAQPEELQAIQYVYTAIQNYIKVKGL
jgi:hypothetical protein